MSEGVGVHTDLSVWMMLKWIWTYVGLQCFRPMGIGKAFSALGSKAQQNLLLVQVFLWMIKQFVQKLAITAPS